MIRLAAVLPAGVLASLAAVSQASAGAPPVAAAAYVIEDAATGQVLDAQNAHEHLPIASITKLMTVLVVLEHRSLTDMVTVDPRAAGVGEESIFLEAGQTISVGDLVKGALIQSGNDAADALALSLAPSFAAFAQLMNAKAAELGLADTHFVRPDGLDAPGEYSSAADATTLGRAAMRIRAIRDTVGKRVDTLADGSVVHTWDDLLGVFPNLLGVKTGHTGKAGWCQVAAARGRGVTVYATILGSPGRTARNEGLETLLAWGLAQFRVVEPVDPARVTAQAGLPFGLRPLGLRPARRLLTVARVGRPLTERVTAVSVASLPVRAGTVLGRVEVWDGKRLVGRRDLVADRTVMRPGTLRRVRWYAARAAHHLTHFFSSL